MGHPQSAATRLRIAETMRLRLAEPGARERGRARDAELDGVAAAAGWTLVRIKGHEVREGGVGLARVLGARRVKILSNTEGN